MKNLEKEDYIFLSALENAVSHNSLANSKAIIGRIIIKFPEIKKNFKENILLIEKICIKVNKLSKEDRNKELLKLNSTFFEDKKINKKENIKKKGLIELKNVSGEVITRFSPAPSGNLHIGHLYGIIFNLEYVKMYGGSFIVRLEDTNPKNISLKNYDEILEDINWISDFKISKIYIQSERILIYYKYLQEVISKGLAYVCNCQSLDFKKFNDNKLACPHRNRNIKENLDLFFKMKDKEIDEQQHLVIRFKADLENKNPALRDFPIARLNFDSHPIVKNKYFLWPMYNFATAIDDSLMKITHIIRGKDHEINGIRQDMIKDSLNLKKSEYFHYGRIKFTDINLSKTEISKKIEDGQFDGWADPRAPTLKSFKRRGYLAKAFIDLIVSFGISKRDSKISIEQYYKGLDFFNKKYLDPISKRFFAIRNPILLQIENICDFELEKIILPKHPENKDFGFREFKIEDSFFIEKEDFSKLKIEDIFRLMHFANFKLIENKNNKIKVKLISTKYSNKLNLVGNFNFLPKTQFEEAILVTRKNEREDILVEKFDCVEINSSIQFERLGFVRFDSILESKKIFYFSHK